MNAQPTLRDRAHGPVVLYAARPYPDGEGHLYRTHERLAQDVAALLGRDYEGLYDPVRHADLDCYFVPNDTLLAADAARLGIASESRLFGGVVPHAFVASKCISHPLPHADAVRPAGWSHRLAHALVGHVVPGFTVFDRADAAHASIALLERHGRIRLKQAGACGGHGQDVVADAASARSLLGRLDEQALRDEGLVCEIDLQDAMTWSVGEIRIGELAASYYGLQRSTSNNAGAQVYGGSSLNAVRGGFAELLTLDLPEPARVAVSQARAYHEAVRSAFPSMFASRNNYDVIQGRDGDGEWRSGVLEQSWRIGGATGAELAALRAFAQDAGLRCVRASTHEAYGTDAAAPPDATVHFNGHDRTEGVMIKYVKVEADGNA